MAYEIKRLKLNSEIASVTRIYKPEFRTQMKLCSPLLEQGKPEYIVSLEAWNDEYCMRTPRTNCIMTDSLSDFIILLFALKSFASRITVNYSEKFCPLLFYKKNNILSSELVR